jgi:hypothetical protein
VAEQEAGEAPEVEALTPNKVVTEVVGQVIVKVDEEAEEDVALQEEQHAVVSEVAEVVVPVVDSTRTLPHPQHLAAPRQHQPILKRSLCTFHHRCHTDSSFLFVPLTYPKRRSYPSSSTSS